MKHRRRNPIRISTTLGAIVLSSALLGSCGGGTSAVLNAGIGGTGIVFGAITGFGSVWLNGRRFEIPAGIEIIVDGELLTEDELAVGMVVRLDVDTENGMFGRAAAKVTFDDAIQGPVETVLEEGGVKRLTILKQQVTVDSTRTVFVDTDYASIGANDVLEISGFRIDKDKIIATYVRKLGIHAPGIVTEVELRGTVENLDADIRRFSINGVQIEYRGARKIDVKGGRLEEDMLVEVEGIFVSDTSVYAIEIEQEDEAFGTDVDEISLHGIVSGYSPNGAGLDEPFFVNGQQVDASMADRDPENIESLMQNGLEVEVEGEIVNGVLIAEELELRADTELRTRVISKDDASKSFTVAYPGLGDVTVNTSAQTLFEDDLPASDPNFSYDLLMIGDFVEVEGVEINNTVGAHTVERRDPNDIKLQGAVDAFVADESITILGVTYPVDESTIYIGMTATDFYSALRINDIVELEDYEPDGVADEVELDD